MFLCTCGNKYYYLKYESYERIIIMSKKTIQDLLPFVEQPSRYLGSEINTIRKNLESIKLKMCLAYPELYDIGTSHFGMQILYHILNSRKEIAAERVYAPKEDMADLMRTADVSLSSLESEVPLIEFDIIGFSLLYELNYTNILYMLDLAGIPFLAEQRDKSYPFIIAGGPCTSNPEPVADIFDAIVIGDGEGVVLEIADVWLEWSASFEAEKDDFLARLSKIKGIYVPSFFTPSYYSHNHIRSYTVDESSRVERVILPALSLEQFPEAPILPFGRPVHDRLRLEIARGCTRGCRFCQAGMIYRPVRERKKEDLLHLAQKGILATGYEDISLLSLSTGDYGCLNTLMHELMITYSKKHVSVSLPSIRADRLTPEMMSLIKRVRKTGFTIAPEAGSQRLRDVINKNLTESEIITTVTNAFELGWNIIKLYFMIGLPTETQADLEEIVALVKKIKSLKASKGGRKQVNVSISTFVPKAHTPFQWVPQISLETCRERIFWLKDHLRLKGVNFKYQIPEASMLEGLFARGDRKLNRVLISAYRAGCLFDGWTDKLHFRRWMNVLAALEVDIDSYTLRERDFTEPLPWDHVHTGLTKEYLKDEWRKALDGSKTADCRNDACQKCGVCDFTSIGPIVYPSEKMSETIDTEGKSIAHALPPAYKKVLVTYSKIGNARYFGHLEMVSIFFKAIKRTGAAIDFTKGFHPKPKVSFNDPLPIGIESESEHFVLYLENNVDTDVFCQSLNTFLPDGLNVSKCKPIKTNPFKQKDIPVTYHISLSDEKFDAKRILYFETESEFNIERTNRKGKISKLNLKDMIIKIDLLAHDRLQVTIVPFQGGTIRPADILTHIFLLSEDVIRKARIVKLERY